MDTSSQDIQHRLFAKFNMPAQTSHSKHDLMAVYFIVQKMIT